MAPLLILLFHMLMMQCVNAEEVSCDDLESILVIPEDIQCVIGPALISRDLPQNHPIDEIYNLTARDGITFIAFAPEGGDDGLGDANFDDYFSSSLQDNDIVWSIKASIEDLGDYEADGNNDDIKPSSVSSKYRLEYANDIEILELTIAKFEFKIEDINNKPPVFENENYIASLREDWPLDLEIPDLKVSVRDLDYTDAPLKLSFDSSCPLDPVSGADVSITAADYSEITFKLKAKLDYEANPTVTCDLTATDTVNEGSTRIVITVEAGQDKPPKFDNLFYWIVLGNQSPGDPLPVQPAPINAVDQDEPPTAITYTMADTEDYISGTDYFKIEESTAIITLIKELDEAFLNEHSQIHFVIYASDAVGEQDKAFLEINLPGPSTNPTDPTAPPGTTTVSGPTTHEPSGPDLRKDSYLFQ